MSENETASLRPSDVVRRNPSYVFRWEESQKAHILLYPEGVVKLNATAGEILELCTGQSVREIIACLEKKFAADVSDDTLQFLEEALEKGWIRVGA